MTAYRVDVPYLGGVVHMAMAESDHARHATGIFKPWKLRASFVPAAVRQQRQLSAAPAFPESRWRRRWLQGGLLGCGVVFTACLPEPECSERRCATARC